MIDAGIAVSGLTSDYDGNSRPNPPSLGAIEYLSATVTPNLSFTSIANPTWGAAPFAVPATSDSPGAITYAVTSGPATISGSTVTLTGAGTVTLTASQAASGNYSTATASTSFTVEPATPSLSFVPIPGKTYGAAPFTVSASSASPGAVTYSVTSGPATISGSTVTLTGVGTVVLQASQAADGVYAASTASTSFLVSPATPTLAFAAIANPVYGTAPFTVSATSASPGTVTYAVTSGPAVISGNTVTPLGMGIVVLTATQAATADFTSATATASFAVEPIRRTLAFTSIGNVTYGSAPFAVATEPNSGGAVSYSVVSGPAAISGNMVTVTGAGTVVLSASEQASGDYAAATATTSFTVTPATPVLSFSAIGTQTYGEAPFAVSATSASPGDVSYSVASGPATISGSVVTLTGIGHVTLIATQQATANYTATTAALNFVAGAPSFTISPGSGPGSTIATNPGGTAAFSLTATPASATFPNPVNLAVTGLPAGAAASFSPSAIAAGSGATTVTCTIQMSSQSALAGEPWSPAPLVPVALSLLFPVIGAKGARRRLIGKVPPMARALMLLGLALTLSACGSGTTVPASAGHSYPLVVTATDAVTGVANSTNVTLSIQ
jgi:hypothetical protein